MNAQRLGELHTSLPLDAISFSSASCCGAGTLFSGAHFQKQSHPACPRAASIMLADRWRAPQGASTSFRSRFWTGLGSIAVLNVPVHLGTVENHSRDALLLQGACGPA